MAAGERRGVLVTGGSRGIGRVIARSFAERGDRVAVHHGSSPEQAEEVLAGLPGEGHALVQADMAPWPAWSTTPPAPWAGSTSW